MPISKYFGGHGAEVMQSMKDTYSDEGAKKAKSVFYATANKAKNLAKAKKGRKK